MKNQPTGSFFTRLRQRLFRWRTDREIFERVFPHLRGEKNHGYSFDSDAQMETQTEEFKVQALFDGEAIEQQIRNMPDAYARSFRHIMYRDLQSRLSMYEQVARRRVRRTCDPRFIASHA